MNKNLLKGVWFAVLILALVIGCAKKPPKTEGTTEGISPVPSETTPTTFETPISQEKPIREEEILSVEELQSALKDIHFEFDKYDLTAEARNILAENSKYLLQHPTVEIIIEGHCDERGSNEYNMALGEKRALSAKKYLEMLGVSADRMSTISYGEERPIDLGHNEEAWAKNRRAHFRVVSK